MGHPWDAAARGGIGAPAPALRCPRRTAADCAEHGLVTSQRDPLASDFARARLRSRSWTDRRRTAGAIRKSLGLARHHRKHQRSRARRGIRSLLACDHQPACACWRRSRRRNRSAGGRCPVSGRRSRPDVLLLAGLAVALSAGAATSLLLALAPSPFAFYDSFDWLMGSFVDRSLPQAAVALVPAAICCALLLVRARALDLMALGEDVAASLGYEPRRLALEVIVLCSVAVGACVSVCGAIGFVGLDRALRGPPTYEGPSWTGACAGRSDRRYPPTGRGSRRSLRPGRANNSGRRPDDGRGRAALHLDRRRRCGGEWRHDAASRCSRARDRASARTRPTLRSMRDNSSR